MINNKKSPIRDEYIEKYLAEKELDLTATLDAKIHHIAIIVSDYEAAKDFYVNKLGFSVIRENYRSERKDWKLDLRVNEHTRGKNQHGSRAATEIQSSKKTANRAHRVCEQ